MEVVREVRTVRNPMWGGAPFYLYLSLSSWTSDRSWTGPKQIASKVLPPTPRAPPFTSLLSSAEEPPP
jgi:hypothetical protein